MWNLLFSVWLSAAVAQESPEEPPAEESLETVPYEDEEGPVDAAPEEPEEIAYPLLWPGQCEEDDPHFDLEVLYHEGKFDEGLRLAKERFAANAADAAAGWMVVRFMFEIGERFERDSGMDKMGHYTEMIAHAERAIEKNPSDPHLYFARGLAKARLGTTKGVLSSLFMAKDVEADWLKAANSGHQYSSIGGQELIPCDVYQALGVFYRLVPDWWIVQMLAGTRGSLDKSLSFLKKADQCAPNRIRALKELGVTQVCIGTKRGDDAMLEAGKATLRKQRTLKATTATEKIDYKHAQMIIDDPSIACEYSRDGQQDLDKKKLEGK